MKYKYLLNLFWHLVNKSFCLDSNVSNHNDDDVIKYFWGIKCQCIDYAFDPPNKYYDEDQDCCQQNGTTALVNTLTIVLTLLLIIVFCIMDGMRTRKEGKDRNDFSMSDNAIKAEEFENTQKEREIKRLTRKTKKATKTTTGTNKVANTNDINNQEPLVLNETGDTPLDDV